MDKRTETLRKISESLKEPALDKYHIPEGKRGGLQRISPIFVLKIFMLIAIGESDLTSVE